MTYYIIIKKIPAVGIRYWGAPSLPLEKGYGLCCEKDNPKDPYIVCAGC